MQSDLAYLEKVQAVLQAHSEKLAILANLSSLTHQRERYPHTANLLDKLMACSKELKREIDKLVKSKSKDKEQDR